MSAAAAAAAVSVTVTANLKVLYPRSGDEYELNVYGSRASTQLAATQSADVDVATNTVTFTYAYVHAPYLLHIEVFRTSPQPETSFPATVPIGHCMFRFADLRAGQHHDVLGIPLSKQQSNRQAVLVIVKVEGTLPQSVIDAAKDQLVETGQLKSKYLTEWVDQLRGVYMKLDPYHDGAVFTTYRSYLGDIPRFLFPYNASRFRPARGDAVALLAHLFQLTQASWVRDFESLTSEADIGDFLVEMMTMYFRGAIYTYDKTRTSGTTEASVDIWSNLSAFPPTHFTAFDCEDGAHWILQLLSVLRSVRIESADRCSTALSSLQAFMQPYTVCFTLMELLVDRDNRSVRHAIVTMLDTRYLLQKPHVTDYKPALVFESTALTRGAWAPTRIYSDHANRANIAALIQYDECLKLFRYLGDKYRRVAKVVAPVCVVQDRGMYPGIWSIICPDLEGHLKQFVVCKSEAAPPRFVTDVAAFFAYNEPSSCLHTAIDIDLSKQQAVLDTLTEEFPHSILPKVPEHPQYKRLQAGKVRYWVRQHEFEKEEAMWKKAFASEGHDFEATRYPIVDGLDAVAIDI